MEEINKELLAKEAIHDILAHSYSVYFLGLIIGLILDLIWPLRILPKNIFIPIGVVFLMLSPMIILWAQNSTIKFKDEPDMAKRNFSHGPYRFSRNPTHTGILLMMLGFGLLVNSVIIVGIAIISFFICHFIFIEKEEKLLEKKYGLAYLEYKKKVRTWL